MKKLMGIVLTCGMLVSSMTAFAENSADFGNDGCRILSEGIQSNVLYSSHVQSMGWTLESENGEFCGSMGQSFRMEAIRIHMDNDSINGSIQYQAHVQNIGWQDWAADGEMAGTKGMSYRLEGVRIRLTGEAEQKYHVVYRTHVQNIGWQDWVADGEMAGTEGMSYRLEAIEVKLEAKENSEENIMDEKIFFAKNQTADIESVKIIGKNADGQWAVLAKMKDGQAKRYLCNTDGVIESEETLNDYTGFCEQYAAKANQATIYVKDLITGKQYTVCYNSAPYQDNIRTAPLKVDLSCAEDGNWIFHVSFGNNTVKVVSDKEEILSVESDFTAPY